MTSPLNGDDDTREGLCSAIAHAREILSIFVAIEQAELLTALPAQPAAAQRHEAGAALLSIAGRELAALVAQLEKLEL